jgi:hypothetical protein
MGRAKRGLVAKKILLLPEGGRLLFRIADTNRRPSLVMAN